MLTYDVSLEMVNFDPTLPHDRRKGEFHKGYKRSENVTELPLPPP